MDVAGTASFLLLSSPFLDLVFPGDLQPRRSFRDLTVGFQPSGLQSLGEAFGELPDLGTVGAGDAASPACPPGPEVVGAGCDGLPQDHLVPLVAEEFGVPAVLSRLRQELSPLAQGLGVVDPTLAVARIGFADDSGGQLVDVRDVDAGERLQATERDEARPQVGGQVPVEGGQQNGPGVPRRQAVHEVLHPVQGDDRLPRAGATADLGRTGVAPLDQLRLGGVEEHLPPAEVAFLQDALQRLVIGDHHGLRAADGLLPVLEAAPLLGPEGDRLRDFFLDLSVRNAVAQPEEHFAGVPGGVLDEAAEFVVGGQLQDDGDERFGHPEFGQSLRAELREQRSPRVRLGGALRRWRLGCGRPCGGLAAQRALLDGLEVRVLDRSGDLVDAVRQTISVAVDLPAVLDRDQQPVVVAKAEQQSQVFAVDARGPQPLVSFEGLEVETAHPGVSAELVLEPVDRSDDRRVQPENLLVRLVQQAQDHASGRCVGGHRPCSSSSGRSRWSSPAGRASTSASSRGSHSVAVRTSQPARA